jgi:ribonuclease VapC
LLEASRDQKAMLYLSLMNAGEIYYIARRHRGAEQADAMLDDLRVLPIVLSPVTEDRIFAAARLKAEHAMSYADAFAAGLAVELGAMLVTGDPEFKSIEPRVTLMWLQGQ